MLEGGAEPGSRIRISWPVEVGIAQGQTGTVTVGVTRLDGYGGALSIEVLGLPGGITSETETASSGDVVNFTIAFSVAPTTPLATNVVTLRVRGQRLRDSERTMSLRVLNPPSFNVAVEPTAIDVVRGGVAPVTVTLARDNLTAPITLTLESGQAISATFTTNPVPADDTEGLVLAGADVAPGTYSVAIRGAASGAADRTATLSVTVLPEDLQVITSGSAAVRQGRSMRHRFIANASPAVGAVELSAEGLPDGVTAAFVQVTTHEFELVMSVHPLVPAGDYPLVIRLSASGAADAVANFVLTVDASSITLNLAPTSTAVYQGMEAQVRVALERASLDTTVTVAVESVPAGLTATLLAELLGGSDTMLRLQADQTMAPGTYEVVIVATPSGWPGDAAQRRSLSITVRQTPPGDGNVILDWSGCTTPGWVVVQDADGPWLPVTVVNGAARVSITGGRGGVAQMIGDTLLAVRFLTQSEFTDGPEDMCPAPTHSRTASGTGVHVGSSELYRYGFGGATATSTISTPDFTLAGVAPGIHDLAIWGLNTPSGTRGLIRRDQDIPSGGSLGDVSVTVPEGFAPATATMTISGGGAINPGEPVTAAMSLITRESCTINPLYSTPVTAPSTPFDVSGVPGTHRRALDLHLLSLIATRPNTIRTTHVLFRDLTNRTIAMGLNGNDPVVNRLDGAYARLEVAANASLTSYGRTVQLEYDGSGKKVSILASRAYFNNVANVLVITPDFSGAPGWQNSFAPSSDATGSWTMTFSGGMAQPWCEAGLSYSLIKNGTY